MPFDKEKSSEYVPILKQKVHDAMASSKTPSNTDNRTPISFETLQGSSTNPSTAFSTSPSSKQSNIHQLPEVPQLPDFTKRPKLVSTNSSSSAEHTATGINNIHMNAMHNAVRPPLYSVSDSSHHSRNASVSFFSDGLTDEHTYNDLPLNEILDDFEYDSFDNPIDTADENYIENENEIEEDEYDDPGESHYGDLYSVSPSHTPEPYYNSIGKEIDRSQSPFLQLKKPEYTREIPDFYDSEKLKYPYKSPLDYNDEDFEKMNHFQFLEELKFPLPPLLPVYLNSNLLNDSNNKNYKTFPYQYQESTVPHVNEIYKYRINDLNVMDKYSAQKISPSVSISSRPQLNRSPSSTSSTSSSPIPRNIKNGSKLINKARLMRENSSNSNKLPSSKLKHSDKIHLIERNLIPHHVMLNHLITCNLNKDGFITSSCITRYKGKFITQIMYFSNELEKL